MAESQHEDIQDKLNAFFKTFEIPELWNIHLLQTSTAKWQPLPKPANIAKKSNTLLFYSSMSDQKDYVIIITNKRGIDRFDLANNTSTHLTDFPDKLKCKGCEVAINCKNGDLYLIGGVWKCFAIYNIERNEWNIKCLNKDDNREKSNRYSISSVDNLPKIIDNILYVSGWDCNRWYNAKQDKFIDISQENTSSGSTPSTNKETKIIYNLSLNKYIHFGSDSSYLFSSSLSNEIWFFGKHENNECLWYLSGIGLPSVYKRMTLTFVLSFESIIILIYFSKDDMSNDNMLDIQNEIWCLDLQTSEWCKGKANLDMIEDNEGNKKKNKKNNFDQYKLFITDGGEIHLIKLNGENTIHLFMNVCDILNEKLYNKYQEKYDCLVKGFVKNIVKDIKQPIDFPSFLPLILSSYTVFK